MNNSLIIYFIVLIGMLLFILFLNFKYNLLRDDSTLLLKKPYSFARVQLAWWSVIVLAAFAAAMIKSNNIPDLYESTLVLLGISGGTVAAARVVDVSDQRKLAEGKIAGVHQNEESKGFLIDIISDQNGVSIHRLQTVFFNIAIGAWFIIQTGKNLLKTSADCSHTVKTVADSSCLETLEYIIPDLTSNTLILLGLSAGVYTALKSAENAKPPAPATAATKPD